MLLFNWLCSCLKSYSRDVCIEGNLFLRTRDKVSFGGTNYNTDGFNLGYIHYISVWDWQPAQ